MYIRVYGDLMIVINSIMLYSILKTTDLINKINSNEKKNILISVLFSAVYLLLIFIDFNVFVYNSYVLAIVLTIAYSLPCNLYQIVKNYVIINVVGCIIYGVINYMLNIFNEMSVFLILVSCVTVYVFLKLYSLYGKLKKYYRLRVYSGEYSASVTALLDSGNLLVDDITSKPVIIAEKRPFLNMIENKRLRPLYYKSLGNERGVLYVFRADKAVVNNTTIKEPIIGLYESKLCDNGKYNAIIALEHLGG